MAEADVTVDITSIDTDRGFFDEFPFPDYGEWKEEVVKALKGAPFEKVMFTSTYEGLTINPIYSADDIKELPHLDSRPGFVPFVRGTRVGGYLKKAWDICQELTVSLPEDFNDEARFDRERGQTMLNLVLDRPGKDLTRPRPIRWGNGDSPWQRWPMFATRSRNSKPSRLRCSPTPAPCRCRCSPCSPPA